MKEGAPERAVPLNAYYNRGLRSPMILVYCLRNGFTGSPFGLSLSKPGFRILRQAQDRPFDRLRVNGIVMAFESHYTRRQGERETEESAGECAVGQA